jgi:hypothetical protein
MLDNLIGSFFPLQGSVVSGVTEAIMWMLALMSLGGAILCGMIRTLSRLQPRLARVPARRHRSPNHRTR